MLLMVHYDPRIWDAGSPRERMEMIARQHGLEDYDLRGSNCRVYNFPGRIGDIRESLLEEPYVKSISEVKIKRL